MNKIKQFIKQDWIDTKEHLSQLNSPQFMKKHWTKAVLIGLLSGLVYNLPAAKADFGKAYEDFTAWNQKPSQTYMSDINNDGIDDIVRESKWGKDVEFGVEDSTGNMGYFTLKDLEKRALSQVRETYEVN